MNTCIFCENLCETKILTCGHSICSRCIETKILQVKIPEKCTKCNQIVPMYHLREYIATGCIPTSVTLVEPGEILMTIPKDVLFEITSEEKTRINKMFKIDVGEEMNIYDMNTRVLFTNLYHYNMFYYGILHEITTENTMILKDCIAYDRINGHTYTCHETTRIFKLSENNFYLYYVK